LAVSALIVPQTLMAEPSTSLMRAGHTATDATDVWLQGDVFDQALDFTGYGNRLGAQAKPSSFYTGRLGANYPILDDWVLRTELAYGQQNVKRTLAPTNTKTNFHNETVLIQWQPHATDWSIEFGIERQRLLPTSFATYQTNNATVTAAPGRVLASSSSKAKGWRLGVNYRAIKNDDLSLTLGLKVKRFDMQSSYTIFDPALVGFIGANRVPQSTPWKENHTQLLARLDYRLSSNWSTGLDVSHINIQRNGYISQTGGLDYSSTQTLDIWGFYQMSDNITLLLRAHANTHYVLGESPAFYNRSVSHKFNYPFGYLSAGLNVSF